MFLEFLAAGWVAMAPGQSQPAPPRECQWTSAANVDYQACADATAPGDPWHSLAQINLGTQAALSGDNEAAVQHYDAARISGQEITSDSVFHGLRGRAYDLVGRTDEGLDDARTAARLLSGELSIPGENTNPAPDFAYALILPLLYKAEDPLFRPALAAYLELPVDQPDEIAMRAGVLTDIGQYAEARQASDRALELLPDDPYVMNTHCYLLSLTGHAAEGVPYCESAAALAPDLAPVRHSLATALAGAGRCEESAAALAEARRLEPSSVLYRQTIPCTPA